MLVVRYAVVVCVVESRRGELDQFGPGYHLQSEARVEIRGTDFGKV